MKLSKRRVAYAFLFVITWMFISHLLLGMTQNTTQHNDSSTHRPFGGSPPEELKCFQSNGSARSSASSYVLDTLFMVDVKGKHAEFSHVTLSSILEPASSPFEPEMPLSAFASKLDLYRSVPSQCSEVFVRPCCTFKPTGITGSALGGRSLIRHSSPKLRPKKHCAVNGWLPYPNNFKTNLSSISPAALSTMVSARHAWRCVLFRCSSDDGSETNVFLNHDVILDGTSRLIASNPNIVDNITKNQFSAPTPKPPKPSAASNKAKLPNVLYVFLDGATTCLAREALSTFSNKLSETHVRLHDDSHVPMGTRTINNAPAMMSGWPDGESWFSVTDERVLTRHASSYLNDSLFAYYKSLGYTTHIASANEAVDASAGFMGIWSGHPHVDHEVFDIAAEFKAWKSAPTRVGHRDVLDYAVDNVIALWRSNADVPKFSMIYDASAHFPHEFMLRHVGAALTRLLTELSTSVMHNTVIAVMSDHFTHDYRMLSGAASKDPNMPRDVMLSELWLPRRFQGRLQNRRQGTFSGDPYPFTGRVHESKLNKLKKLQHLRKPFVTHYDWFLF